LCELAHLTGSPDRAAAIREKFKELKQPELFGDPMPTEIIAGQVATYAFTHNYAMQVN
jgi:hypothetical protein